MIMQKSAREVRIDTTTEGFREGRRFIVEKLKARRISQPMISETLLVYEALFHEIVEQGFGKENGLTISYANRSGDSVIDIGFDGDVFVPDADEVDEISPDKRILAGYAEKFDCMYASGHNRISLRVRRSRARTANMCMLAILISVAVHALIHFALGAQGEQFLLYNLIYPLEIFFTNAVIMIGAPVTFVSLLKNLTDTFVVSEKHTGVRKFVGITVMSSLVSVALALAVCRLAVLLLGDRHFNLLGESSMNIDTSIGQFILELLPSDIFTPFQTISPFPIVIIAVLVTYASCSAGKYFGSIKKAVDIGYVIFSRMLGIVTYMLPFFAAMAALDLQIRHAIDTGRGLALLVMITVLSPAAMALYYMIRLVFGRVQVGDFVRKLIPLLGENIRIGSGIDAVTFNIRYCARTYGIDRRRLEMSLPLLAEINLDGNCFIITILALMTADMAAGNLATSTILLIPLLVLFLSFGAPNQPGSVLIGMMMLLWHTDTMLLLPLAILSEVFFSGLLNMINVTGDIVTVAIEDGKHKRGRSERKRTAAECL